MGDTVYAIDAFPNDDFLWRIEWIGGIGYNTSVPSDPEIGICLAQLPAGERNPLSARSRSFQTKRTVRISVGLLPYISIASVWRQRRPVVTDLSSCRHRLRIDTSSCRAVALEEVTTSDNAIPRNSYPFGASWPYVRRTLLLAMEQDGDPYAVMVPTAEIIRFYYAPSTRLAQALFRGEYSEMFNAERSGVFEEGIVRVHLRRWLEDQDAWTLARYMCSPVMQREASRLYGSLQLYQLNSTSLLSAPPDQALRCAFPFEGPTTVQGIFLRLPGPTPDSSPRWLILQLERCSAPFPFDQVIVERDNDSAPGANAEDENLMPAWAKAGKLESEVEKPGPDMFQSNEEPHRGSEPLRVGLIEDRFEYLNGKKLVKEEKIVQRYRFSPMKADASQMLTGLGTGQGTWGASNLQLTKLTTVQSRQQKQRDIPVLPANLETFVQAIELLAKKRPCEVELIGVGYGDTSFGSHILASFPTHDPRKGKRIGWAWIKTENRPRRVAVAEIRVGDKIAYALEIERTNQEHAILVLAHDNLQKISASELRSLLLMCAMRRGWVSDDQVPSFQRKTTTHRELVAISVLESRIWRKIEEVFRCVASM